MRERPKEKCENLAIHIFLRGWQTDFLVIINSQFVVQSELSEQATPSVSSLFLTCCQGIQWPILSLANGRAINVRSCWRCHRKQARLAKMPSLARFATCCRNSRRAMSLMSACTSTPVSARAQRILQAPSIKPLLPSIKPLELQEMNHSNKTT